MTTISTEPCPGPCNRDWRANERDTGAPDTDVKAVPGDPVWCQPCRNRIRRILRELVELYAHLELDMGARTRLADLGSIRGSSGHPTPSAQVDLQDEVLRHLLWVEDEIRAARPGVLHRGARPARYTPSAGRWDVETMPPGMYGPPRLLNGTERRERPPQAQRVSRPADRTVAAAVGFIDAHLDWLLDHEDPGRWAGTTLARLHARLRSATSTGSGLSHRTQRCPRCKLKALTQEAGSEYIECQNCGRLVSLDEYADLCAPERQEAASRSCGIR